MTSFAKGLVALIGITLRSAVFLLALLVVVRKGWPGDLLRTPLAQLTLGGLLGGLIKSVVALGVGWIFVWLLFHLPAKEKRDVHWYVGWIIATLALAFVIAFPFLYEAEAEKHALVRFASDAVLTILAWLIS
jgi:hypothetical protein